MNIEFTGAVFSIDKAANLIINPGQTLPVNDNSDMEEEIRLWRDLSQQLAFVAQSSVGQDLRKPLDDVRMVPVASGPAH